MINFKIDFNEIPLKDLISLEGDEDLSEIVPKMVCVLLDFDFLKKKTINKKTMIIKVYAWRRYF